MPTEDAYSSGHLVLSQFGTGKCSNIKTNFSWICIVSGLQVSNIPRYYCFALCKCDPLRYVQLVKIRLKYSTLISSLFRFITTGAWIPDNFDCSGYMQGDDWYYDHNGYSQSRFEEMKQRCYEEQLNKNLKHGIIGASVGGGALIIAIVVIGW